MKITAKINGKWQSTHFTASKREVTSCATLTRMRMRSKKDIVVTDNSIVVRNSIDFKQFQLVWEPKTLCRGLPLAILSISLRSDGSLWIFCITSLAVSEWMKLQQAVRLHHQSTKEEVNDWLQDVLLQQWPYRAVQTRWQNTRSAVRTCRQKILTF